MPVKISKFAIDAPVIKKKLKTEQSEPQDLKCES